MRYNLKSIGITLLLVILLIFVFLMNMGIFVSGPKRKMEDETYRIIEKIEHGKNASKFLYRHSFKYVVYVGETKKDYIWYDASGKKIASRKKKDAQFDKVKNKMIKKGFKKDTPVTLGYGYKHPVYVIEDGYHIYYLDFDTCKEVFYSEEVEE